MTATIITSSDTQMGVTITLQGKEYWLTYLEDEVADNTIDQETADEWEARYDGYEMVWSFSGPQVVGGDNHIDAACIRGEDSYAGGGFCAGIIYVGSLSSQSEKWAAWVTDEEFDDFAVSVGFSSAVDDTENWRTDATSFTVDWTLSRWLPKEERNLDYYSNEYRFVAGDSVLCYAYTYTNDELYTKVAASDPTITLLDAVSLITNSSAVLFAVGLLTAF